MTVLRRIRDGLHCRLCWKVTVGVFFSILAIEAAILVPSVINYERDRLQSIEQAGQNVVSALLAGSGGVPPVARLEEIIERTALVGLEIKSDAGAMRQAGEARPATPRTGGTLREQRRQGDPDRLWLSWPAGDIAPALHVHAGLSTADIDDELRAFVLRIAGLVLLITLFVTVVTMPLLQYLVLGPILALRQRMRAAGEDPAEPLHYTLESARRDEIGDTARAFNRMLRLISDNLHQIADREKRYRELNAKLDQRVAERTEELRRANAALEYRASHDELTGLYNRTPFSESLQQALDRSTAPQVSVLFIGIDNLTSINGLYGYRTGDALLQTLAARLAGHIDQNAVVAHFGGDIFGLLLTAGVADTELQQFAENLRHELQAPATIEEQTLEADVSIGFARRGDTPTLAETLMRQSDLALLTARREQEAAIVAFEYRLEHAMDTRLRRIAGLRRAIDNDEFSLEYQTQHAADGTLQGAEALLRWDHGAEGRISPAEFIPLAEETGLIIAIGDHVLTLAIQQAAAWYHHGTGLGVAVNVSPLQLRDGRLAERVEELLRTYRLPADYLELEITESALVEEQVQRSALLTRLAATGVHLAIDDFGTGYSSLAYLGQLPVHRLKIDRAFITSLPEDERAAEICRSIIGLARQLHLEVLAEGVETEAQLQWLPDQGCRRFQGFLFSRPAPANTVVPQSVE